MDSNLPKPGLLQSSAIFLVASLIIYLIRFVIAVLVARAFGPQGKGIYSLVLLTGSMLLVVLNIGTGSALTYYTASKKFEAQVLVGYAFGAGLLLGIIGGIIFYFLYIFFLSNNLLSGLEPRYILWVTLIIPLNLIALFLSGILIGLQRILEYNALELIRVFLLLVFLVASISLGAGIPGAILGWVAAYLIHFLLISIYSFSKVGVRWQFFSHTTKPIINYGLKSYLANLMTLFTYRLDSYLVNFYAGLTSVGIYSTSVATAEIIWNLPNAVSSALFPKVSGLDEESGSLLTARTCRILILITIPLTLAFGVIGYYLIPVIFGEAFLGSVGPFLLLLPGMIFVLISKILSANLSGRGKPQYAAYTATITLGITILLDIYWIPRLGVPGAAIASTVAYLAGAVSSLFWFQKVSQIHWLQVIIVNAADLLFIRQKTGSILVSSRAYLQGKSR
jgi:O-antigen/teichoic acid export membrane protein